MSLVNMLPENCVKMLASCKKSFAKLFKFKSKDSAVYEDTTSYEYQMNQCQEIGNCLAIEMEEILHYYFNDIQSFTMYRLKSEKNFILQRTKAYRRYRELQHTKNFVSRLISFYEIQKQGEDGFESFMDSYFKIFYDIINKSMHILQLEYPEIEEVPRMMRQMRQDNLVNSINEFTSDITDSNEKNQIKSFINFPNNTTSRTHTLSKKEFFPSCPLNSDESLLVNVDEKQLIFKDKKKKESINFPTNKSTVISESPNLYSNLLFYLPKKNLNK